MSNKCFVFVDGVTSFSKNVCLGGNTHCQLSIIFSGTNTHFLFLYNSSGGELRYVEVLLVDEPNNCKTLKDRFSIKIHHKPITHHSI